MLLKLLQSTIIVFFVSIRICFLKETSAAPVLFSSMRSDSPSHNETYERSWKANVNSSSLPGKDVNMEEDMPTFNSSELPKIKTLPNSAQLSSTHILPSFTSKLFSTNHIQIDTPSYESNFVNIDSNDSFTSNIKSSVSNYDIYESSTEVLDIKPTVQSELETVYISLETVTPNKYKSSSFHTPLMSSLIASSSLPLLTHGNTVSHFLPHTSLSHSATTNLYNESSTIDIPTNNEHKKLLMLVLRAEDCSKLSKEDFEKMLGKLMIKFGFENAVPEISNAKCFSHLHINLTIGGKTPNMRFLPNIEDKNNITVDVLNRTFRVVKFEKIDLRLEKTKSTNASTIITSLSDHESIAYLSVGITFGLVLALCFLMCCIKCCCVRKSKKRFTNVMKGAHLRLRPEDYTLTPIPRPTSLYVDYYRGSLPADIYSTTSAASIASTTPTVDQGIIQPFDTSIVPLEDSSNLQVDCSRDSSVESVSTQSNLKTFNIHGFSAKGLRSNSTDSKEPLNPKQNSRKVGSKTAGVANPTFQRY